MSSYGRGLQNQVPYYLCAWMWINWEKEIFEIKMNLWRRKLSRPINKCPFLIGVPDQTNRKWEVTSYALVTKKLLWERIPQEPIIVALEFPVYWVNPSIKDWIRNNPSMNRRFEIRSVWSTKKRRPKGRLFLPMQAEVAQHTTNKSSKIIP